MYYIFTYMRTNIVLAKKDEEKWWEIKKEAKKMDMTIGEYIIFCHNIRKTQVEHEDVLKLLNIPLSGGNTKIDVVKESKKMWIDG